MKHTLLKPRSRQRGVGALAVSMLLLFASSIIVFYLNRGLIFEQKTAANQARSTGAFEIAEAGVEWATGMLNAETDVDANCAPLATRLSTFRQQYLLTGGSVTTFMPTTNTFAGCKINGTALTCRCPTPAGGEQVANLPTAVQPGFTVAFSRVPILDPATGAALVDPATGAAMMDPTSIRVVSTGCTAQAGACKPDTTAAGGSAATTGASDASARVEVVLKFNPTLRAMAVSTLTCGTSCNVSGSSNIKNTEVSSNGYLVNAGTTIASNAGTGYETIPGQPTPNALIADDSSLFALSSPDPTCSKSSMFKTYFGTTLQKYAESNDVKKIPGCDNPSTCGGLVLAAYNDGWRDFYFPDGFALNNSAPFSVLGVNAVGKGVKIVTPKDISVNGNITINGLLFSNSAAFDVAFGTADVNGAVITCAGYKSTGNGLLNYSSAALTPTPGGAGTMVRVPGSWRDFQ